jgi:HD-GYP domain-containing protein (c-di-GMP phosphodiesterase class II)
MRVLLVSDNPDLKELLSFQISTRNPVAVKECKSAREGVDLLKKENNGFALLIAPYNGADSVLVKYLSTLQDPMPCIFFYDSSLFQPKAEEMNNILVLGFVDQSKLIDGVNHLILDFLKDGRKDSAGSEYCPIRTSLLIKATPLKSDIYIRLSADKYIKLFKTGDEFDSADLKRYYETKGVEYMYLKRTETDEFIGKFRAEIESMLAKPELKQEEALQSAEMNQEAIQEMVQKIGFNEEVQDLAKKNVLLTLKAIGTNPRLQEVLGKVIRDGNYLSQHSTVLAHLSCCIAKELEWGSESTFSKLVLASYMHDITITDPELAKVSTLKDLEKIRDKFSAEDVKNYHLHPAKSADVVRSFKEIPADVDLIVQQHHERPNGGGFPRGLAHNYISPLGALFIVAHELTITILEKKEDFDLVKFLSEKKPFFSMGNFKKVMAALEKITV